MDRIDLGTVDVVLYQEEGQWIAQGIQFDVTARGGTPQEASDRFHWKLVAELVISNEVGDAAPLAGVPPAPQKFWQMFTKSRMNVETEYVPARVMDNFPPVPHLRPRMKISDQVAA